MPIFQVIAEIITNPPIPHEPHKQSLKAWAMYCLRDRGFKVVYAQDADFAVEIKGGKKLYFQVTDSPLDLDKTINWVVWDSIAKTARFIPVQSQDP